MNVSLKNLDATKGILKLEIVKADYADQVEKGLRSFRQKANMPGFRKGMVPMGMVKKLYGKQVLAEEINQLVSENLFNYIRDSKLNILGEPMPNETEQKEINFDTQEDFEFCFDVALAPEIHLELSKNDKVPYYQVKIDDEVVNKQVESYQANFGEYVEADDVEEQDLVKGTVAELENGAPKEGGIVVEEAVLMPMYIKNDEEKAKFIGAKKNGVIVFNPSKAYDSDVELASFLKVDKEVAATLTGDFSFEIKTISRHGKAELNQDLFDKVFEKGTVTTEEEFRNKLREILAEQFEPQSDFKFLNDAREMLLQKVGKLEFADDLLKRWLQISQKQTSKAKIEEDYPNMIEGLTYQLIKEYLVKEYNLKVEEADVREFSRRVAKAQFSQYGMLSVPENVLDNYANEMLKNKQTAQNVFDRALELKLSALLKEQIEPEIKELTIDEFNKLLSDEVEQQKAEV